MMDIEHYNKNRGIYSPLIQTDGGMISGFWLVGNDYRNPSKYYGAYPPGYLKRLALLFPDPKIVLHLFSGMVEKGAWNPRPVREITCDCKEDLRPDVCENAEEIQRQFEPATFDLILADPPYGNNFIKYNTFPINKRKIVKKCSNLLCEGGYLIWLDISIPIWAKIDGWRMAGAIGLIQSTNHACRVITILERV